MKRLILALLLLLLTSCRWESDTVCDPRENLLPVKPDEETWFLTQLILSIINTYAVELEAYHQIWLEHSYAIRGDDGRFYIWVDFTTQSLQDIPGARRLSVLMIEDLLKRLNENENLLATQDFEPFTSDNLYFSIEYTSFYGRYIDTYLVGRSELKYGYMNVFYAQDAFQLWPVVYHKHSEPYETSVLIVEAQDAANKRIKPTREMIYDQLTSRIDWFSGDPDYIRETPDIFDSNDFRTRGVITNYPKKGDEENSGALKVWNSKGGR